MLRFQGLQSVSHASLVHNSLTLYLRSHLVLCMQWMPFRRHL